MCSGKKETLHGPRPEGGGSAYGNSAVKHDGTRIGNLGVSTRVRKVESEILGSVGTVKRMMRASSTLWRKAR